MQLLRFLQVAIDFYSCKFLHMIFHRTPMARDAELIASGGMQEKASQLH